MRMRAVSPLKNAKRVVYRHKKTTGKAYNTTNYPSQYILNLSDKLSMQDKWPTASTAYTRITSMST
jgi:hypothetical protein